MTLKGLPIASLLLFGGLAPCPADPVRHQDISADSPWAAHIDVARMCEPPLDGFLRQVAGFDRILELQTSLKDKLDLDWKLIKGVTLFGSSGKANATSIIIRGDLKKTDPGSLPTSDELSNYQGVTLKKGLHWIKTPLILAPKSDQEWVAGTTLQATKNSLDLLAGRKDSRPADILTEEATKELQSAAAMFSLDMKKLNAQLNFEADFTRAIRQAWCLIGTRDDLIEATLMINSADADGLVFLQEQLQLLTLLITTKPTPPPVWLELGGALKVETKGNWMTLKMAATPKKAALFLKSLEPLFVKAEVPSNVGK